MTCTPPARTLWFQRASASASDPVEGLESLILDGLVSVPTAGPPVRLPGGLPDLALDRSPAARDETLVLVRAVFPPAGDSAVAAAVLLVSDERGGAAPGSEPAARAVPPPSVPLTVNGIGVGEGMHLLCHGDSVVRGGLRLWLSVDRAAEEGTYDPDIDGRDVFCARTKLRLEPGDPIVRCPGTPTRGCELVFRASTWDASLRCHQCGHDPAAPRWTPPVARGRGALTSRLEKLLSHATDD